MSFFNTKEEVIDIELTPYGKHLLSQGKWKPAYYEFYDDDVIYDQNYAGSTEQQDEIKRRIKETKRTKVQYSFEGADTRYKEYIKQAREKKNTLKNSLLQTLEKRKNFSLSSLPLGTSKIANKFYPAWAIKSYTAKIDSISSGVAISGLPNNLNVLNIEPLQHVVSYEISITEREDSFEDNSYITVEENSLLLDIVEENVYDLKKNFDLFLYLIDTDVETGEEIEKPLSFCGARVDKERVVNGILLDLEEDFGAERATGDSFIDPDCTNYYFSLSIDDDIDTSALAPYLSEKDKKKLSITTKLNVPSKIANQSVIPGPTQEAIDKLEDC